MPEPLKSTKRIGNWPSMPRWPMSVSPAAPVPAVVRSPASTAMIPGKAVRMAALGLDQELIDSRFPWVCTLCGRCELLPHGREICKNDAQGPHPSGQRQGPRPYSQRGGDGSAKGEQPRHPQNGFSLPACGLGQGVGR